MLHIKNKSSTTDLLVVRVDTILEEFLQMRPGAFIASVNWRWCGTHKCVPGCLLRAQLCWALALLMEPRYLARYNDIVIINIVIDYRRGTWMPSTARSSAGPSCYFWSPDTLPCYMASSSLTSSSTTGAGPRAYYRTQLCGPSCLLLEPRIPCLLYGIIIINSSSTTALYLDAYYRSYVGPRATHATPGTLSRYMALASTSGTAPGRLLPHADCIFIPSISDDPVYKRSSGTRLWQKYKKYITIVMSSYSSLQLEFADRVFVFDSKTLVFGGTPGYMFFKYGREYRVRMTFRGSYNHGSQTMSELLQRASEAGASVRAHLGSLLILRLPSSPTPAVAALIKHLDDNASKYGIISMSISLPDTEEVTKRAIIESKAAALELSPAHEVLCYQALKRIDSKCLELYDLIPLGNIHCYADDSTVHAGYLGQAAAGQAVTKEKRKNLVIELNQALDHISEWGTRNLVEFNDKKTQACAFAAKTSPFLPLPSLQGTTLPLQSNISMLGMEVRLDLNPKDYIETVIKTASRKLGVLNKVRRFFTPDQLCLLYKTQVRSCVEYCSHLWDGSDKYLLDALDRLQRRAIRIIGDEEVTKHLEPLQLRRDVASLSAFYRLYHGECSEELFSLIPPSPFLQRTTRAGLRCHRLTVATIPTRTKKFGDSFLCRTIRKWNALPAHVFPPSYNLGSFKRGVKKQHAGRQGDDGWCGR
ncbi:hypothetical protein evm_015018 [Chilo suppressalis]|nr:hypothetical protein evm_015018 [Chilo suppressalis]